MKPIHRFYSIVITITAIIVFAIWTISSCILSKHPDWINSNYYLLYGFAAILTYLVTYGTFQSVFSIINYLFENWNWLKRVVMSSSYLEGTWVGFYIGVFGKVRYIIETYEQTFDETIIKGTSFDETKNLHSFWTSVSVNVNIDKGEILYQYRVKPTIEKTDPNGIAYFSIIRGNNKKPAKEIIGFSNDSHLTKKCKAMEYKLSSSTEYNLNEAIENACNFYQTKKEIIFNKDEQ